MRPFLHSSRSVLPALIGLALPLGLVAQQPASPEVLQLPTYTVTTERELPPPEQWFYTRIEGFEILSNASAGNTKQLVDDFQRFAFAVGVVWPAARQNMAGPASLIICGRNRQFELFRPDTEWAPDHAITSLMFSKGGASAIVLDYQTKAIDLTGLTDGSSPDSPTDSPTVSPTDSLWVDPYLELKREYVKLVLARQEQQPPPWLAEGIARLLRVLEFSDTAIAIGKVSDPKFTSTDGGDFRRDLTARALVPMQEMFTMVEDSLNARQPIGSVWGAQCYAFVHWGLFGDQSRNHQHFLRFVNRIQREPLTEELFKDCFQKTYAQMLFVLRSYSEWTRHKVVGVKAGKGQKIPYPPEAVVREATQAEIGRIKGDALALAGKAAEARTALVTAYRRGEREPALLASLGLAELAAGDQARARKFLEAAVAGRAVRPRAHLELARLRLTDGLAKPGSELGKLSTAQTAHVLEPLFTARDQPPSLPEVYELMAEAWARSAFPPKDAHLAALEQGVKLFPRNAALIYQAAELRAKHGFAAEAHSLVRLGLRVAPDALTRTKFEQLQANLPPEPPGPVKN